MDELVRYGRVDSAAILMMNRPDKRNALSRALIVALHAAFERAAVDPTARSVILTGSGTAFCAGMDLDELRGTVGASAEPEIVWDDAHRLSALYELIYTLPKPTIAAVNGAAVAGGAGLVSVCDLAIAVPGAKFGYPEVRRGLVAAMVLPHLLRHVGERAARRMLLTGELIGAAEAVRIGFVNDTAEPDVLLEAAARWAAAIAEGGPKALASTKALLALCSLKSVPLAELAHASAEPRLTDECREGLAAFFEKRPVAWH